jgi:hypothetical protein
MAFLADDDKLLEDQQQQDPNGQSQGSAGGQFLSGGSGADVGTGTANSAGVGAGGTGGWTNIQSYLNANKQDTGSADYVNQKIGSQFDQENQKLMDSANTTKQQGVDQANRISQAAAGAKDTIADAAKSYDWSGNQSNEYTQKLQPLKSALYDQYSGPSSFSYGFSDQTQKAKDAVSDDKAMGSYLEDTYRERAGKPMTQGQLSLQRQFDTTNDPLALTRQNLLKRYAGLEETRDTTVKDTDSALRKAAEDYGNNQNQLKSTLMNYGNDRSAAVAQAEAGARENYAKDAAGTNPFANWDPRTARGGTGSWIDEQIRHGRTSVPNFQNFVDSNTGQQAVSYLAGNDPDSAWQLNPIFSQIDNFYQSSRDKYANTADSEKRQYNAIMDLLNQADRQKQGFDVVNRTKNSRGV